MRKFKKFSATFINFCPSRVKMGDLLIFCSDRVPILPKVHIWQDQLFKLQWYFPVGRQGQSPWVNFVIRFIFTFDSLTILLSIFNFSSGNTMNWHDFWRKLIDLWSWNRVIWQVTVTDFFDVLSVCFKS